MSDISLYRRFEDIAEPQWSELLAHSADATVFQQYAWVRAWRNSFQQPKWQLHLLCASEGGTPAGSYAGSLGLTAVPEPGTLALFGFGLAAAGFAARRGRKASV